MKLAVVVFAVTLATLAAGHGSGMFGRMAGMEHLEHIQKHKQADEPDTEELMKHFDKVKIAGRSKEHGDPEKVKGILKTLRNKDLHEKQLQKEFEDQGLGETVEMPDGKKQRVYSAQHLEALNRRKAERLYKPHKLDGAKPLHNSKIVTDEEGNEYHLDDYHKEVQHSLHQKYVNTLQEKRLKQKFEKSGEEKPRVTQEEMEAHMEEIEPVNKAQYEEEKKRMEKTRMEEVEMAAMERAGM
eukprot:CAMPEP_0113866788 /NCGR_PEP_ID=MMETSP0780_2-20120614/61_1 /TAXON_ID=652834 /ORGANISM="Palpitomonas bilix" /LENGTH=240 /DNA_ID=CAMNT_0000851665 /DNA_START=17 /DNA_END=739 /DNA_ORIENTATION=- /assembly_acc=CAM_ASM_000599